MLGGMKNVWMINKESSLNNFFIQWKLGKQEKTEIYEMHFAIVIFRLNSKYGKN